MTLKKAARLPTRMDRLTGAYRSPAEAADVRPATKHMWTVLSIHQHVVHNTALHVL